MKWLRPGLQIIGALSLLLFVIAAIVIGSDIYSGMSERFNKATPKDTLFILNWGGIPTNQNFKVIASYQSRRSFTGDHVDYYCIELPKFEVADIQKNEWHDGPEENYSSTEHDPHRRATPGHSIPYFPALWAVRRHEALEDAVAILSPGEHHWRPSLPVMFESAYGFPGPWI